MVNLLPKSTKIKLRLNYYVRLTTTALVVLSVVAGMGIALLVPSYLFARDQAETGTRYLATVQESAGLQKRSSVTATISLVSERIKILKEYERTPSAAHILSRLESPLPKDVILEKIAVNYSGAGQGNILISGIAQSRNGLLNYSQSLQKESIFSGVKVPVSQLSLDRDIDFSLSFAFKLTP